MRSDYFLLQLIARSDRRSFSTSSLGLTQTAFRRACITFFDLARVLQERVRGALIHRDVHRPLSRFLIAPIGCCNRSTTLATCVNCSIGAFVKANQAACRISRYCNVGRSPPRSSCLSIVSRTNTLKNNYANFFYNSIDRTFVRRILWIHESSMIVKKFSSKKYKRSLDLMPKLET